MTNPSLPKTTDLPKIADLLVPSQRRGGFPAPAPDAAERFDQLLKTAVQRPGNTRPDPVPRPRAERPDRAASQRPDRFPTVERPEAPAPDERPDDVVSIDDGRPVVEPDESSDDAAADQEGEPAAEEQGDEPDGDSPEGNGQSDEDVDQAGTATTPAAGEVVLEAVVGELSASVTGADGEAGTEAEEHGATVTSSVDLADAVNGADEDTDMETVPPELLADRQVAALAKPVTEDEVTAGDERSVETEAPADGVSESAEPDVVVNAAGPGSGSSNQEGRSAEAALTDDSGQQGAPEGGDPQPESTGDQGQPAAAEAAEAPVPQSALTTQSSAAENGLVSQAGTANSAVTGTRGATTAATPAAEASATGQVVSGEDGELLWRQVRRAIGSLRTMPSGEQQMTIRLRPAELGSVMVRISTGEAGTTVALVTESAAAASQLNQQRQQLISELEEGGLSDVAVDVGTSDAQQRETAESEGDVDENGNGGQRSSIGGGQEAETVDRFRARRNDGAQRRLVDVDL